MEHEAKFTNLCARINEVNLKQSSCAADVKVFTLNVFIASFISNTIQLQYLVVV